MSANMPITTTRTLTPNAIRPSNGQRSTRRFTFRDEAFLERLRTEKAALQEDLVVIQRRLEAIEVAERVWLVQNAPADPDAPITATIPTVAIIAPQTTADAVEQILAGPDATGTMHADDITQELLVRYGMQTTTKNLVNILNRWISRDKRFKRTAPNTYTLKGGGRGTKAATKSLQSRARIG